MSRLRLFGAVGVAVLAVVLALALTGNDGDDERAEPLPAARTAPPAAPPAGRPATRGAERVIRSWLAAVRESDFERAASFFAAGARVQNGGPPRTLDNPALAIAWNATLPCGAVLTSIQPGFDGSVVARFRLTHRRGADCGSGIGAPAASRIKVRDGRITEWIRLADGRPLDTVKT